ncbi:MAG TPA: hypothetical protein EYM99_13970 [Alphaproteobacteria bacterium]|nr:hypothetical protein [Alphaproteobacteria bacterium]
MSFPFWLAFGASGFVHVAAIAAVFTIVETEQSLAPKKLTVELVHESSFKTAPFTATAVHFPPIKERSHAIHEPIVLAERQPTLHLAPPQTPSIDFGSTDHKTTAKASSNPPDNSLYGDTGTFCTETATAIRRLLTAVAAAFTR